MVVTMTFLSLIIKTKNSSFRLKAKINKEISKIIQIPNKISNHKLKLHQ